MDNTKQVLDKGFCRLDGAFADDLSVVNAARVSFAVRHKEMEKGDKELIHFLMKNRHGTPFESNFIRFHVKAPIFVFREWHRHRIGISINEQSARYSKLNDDFYVPSNVRSQVGKPGHYTYEPAPSELKEPFRQELEEKCKIQYEAYEKAMDAGIAKEQARLFLPTNIYSEMIWSCNARSLMAFLSLRNTDKAQWEIRQYAIAMEEFFLELMPITAQAFIDNGRIVP